MKSQVTPQALVEVLDRLCYVCPKGEYTEKCPFPKFSGISRASRMAHFGAMDREQVESLFALATDCACPKDPGRNTPPLSGESAGGGLRSA